MEPYRVYWQPGCTSCLKAKEFLASHGIAFESINVRAQPGAMEELARFGVRSVPVIARGDRFCFGQELEEVARFIGVPWRRERLPVSLLFERLQRLLSAAERLAAQLPERAAETPIEGRPDRSFSDLGYHVAMIVEAFLAAARGEQLTFAFFERRPIGAARASKAVAARIATTAGAFSSWCASNAAADPDRPLDTYYGAQPLHGVLERTVWHAAQHCRQLEHIILSLGIEPKMRLGDAELDGLPLPIGVWDKEVSA